MKSSMNEAQFELTQNKVQRYGSLTIVMQLKSQQITFYLGLLHMCYLQGSTQLYSSHIRHYIGPEVWSVKQ